MEFEWNNFPRFTTLGILDEIQETMTTELKCEPEHFKGRIIFLSMYIGQNEETEKIVLRMLAELLGMLENSREAIGHFKGVDRRRIATELMSANLMENSSNNYIRQSTVSVHGAVAALCGELARDSKATGKPRIDWETDRISHFRAKFLTLMPKYKETCCVNMSRNSQNFLNDRNWPNSAPMLVSRRILRKDIPSLHLMMVHFTVSKDHVESILYLAVMNHPTWKGGSVETRIIKDITVWKSLIESSFRDRTISWVRIVNGINKYETETSEEIPVASVGDRSAGKPVAKAWRRPTPTLTLSLVSLPYRNQKWIDIDP